LSVGEGVSDALVTIAYDPQTSGGLLAAIPPGATEAVGRALSNARVDYWWIGQVEDAEAGSVALV
jgi:selenide,water dikinase